MKNNIGTLEGIFDIEPPPTPALSILESYTLDVAFPALLVIGLLLMISALIWKHYYSPTGKSLRHLSRLQKQFSSNKINSHVTACQISIILRKNLMAGHILNRAFFPEELNEHKARWDTFTKRLTLACYSAKNITPETTSLLFDDANFWIQSWPRNKNG